MKRKLICAVVVTIAIVAIVFCTQGKAAREWTAVGDDGMTGGPAVGHMMAWSLDSIAIVNADRGIDGWDTTAIGVSFIGAEHLPQYATPGTEVSVSLPWSWFPSDTVIFMCVKAFDDATDTTGQSNPNWGALGNIVRWRTPDTIAPAAILDLR